MAEDLLALADRLWMGEEPAEERHPWTPVNQVAEVADGVGFVSSFANVSAFATRDGLVLVDTGSFMLASQVHELVRGWTDLPLSHAIWTHGHVDHVFGVDLYEAERSQPAPTVVAHEGVPLRHDRYRRSAGWNRAINERQFQAPGLTWPTEYRRPDVTYRNSLTLRWAARSSNSTTRAAKPTTTPGFGSPAAASCAAATCSAGRFPTPGTRRRFSATPATGWRPCVRWRRSGRK